MTFTEFADYVLARLYELGDNEGRYHNLNQLAAELVDPVPPDWPAKVAQALENRGLVDAAISMRMAGALITGDGMLYVEGRDHDTAVIEAYRAQPSIYINIAGDANQLAVTGAGAITQAAAGARIGTTPEVVDLLAKLMHQLREATLDQDELAEYLTEVETAKRQVTKAHPNYAAAAALLEPIAKVAAVAELVQEILRLLGHG